MNINIEITERFTTPFPYVIIKNPLTKTDLKSLIKDFPQDTSKYQNVMGGRARLASEEPEFFKFIEDSYIWNSFYNTVNSKKFADKLLNIFSNEIGNFKPQFETKNLVFSKDYLKTFSESSHGRASEIKKQQVHNVKTKDLLFLIMKRLLSKIKVPIISKFNLKNKNSCHMHFDLSEAGTGYVREAHHDNEERIVAFVFYLNSPTGMKGGEFAIHETLNYSVKTQKNTNLQPNIVSNIKLINPKENTMIVFLSTPNSFHSVPKIVKTNDSRKFVYGGFSLSHGNAWLKC